MPQVRTMLISLAALALLGCPPGGRGDDDSTANDDDSTANDDDSTANDDDSTANDDDSTANDDDSTANDDDSTANDDDSTANDDDVADDDDATAIDPCPSPISLCSGGSCLQNIDLDPVRVTGLLQWGGAAIPAGGTNAWSFVFVDTSTGNTLRVERDAGDGPAATYDIPMLPGTYDVFLEWRDTVSDNLPAFPDPIWGLVPVATSFSVPTAGGSLNVQPDPVRVTGLLQWDGAAIPAGDVNAFSLVFVDGSGNELRVDRDAGDGAVSTYDVPMMPGTYDVFLEWRNSANPSLPGWPDPIDGRIPVATSFNVPTTGASLNVQPDPVRVTGLLQWDGAAIPASGLNAWDVVFEDVNSERVYTVPRDASAGAVSTYDIPMLPGTYDVSFAWMSTTNATSASWPDPVYGELPVATSFTVPTGGGSLNIEPDPVRVTGLLQWDGSPVPQSASNQWTLSFTDLASDRVFTVERDTSQGVAATFDIPMLAGTYAVDWVWRSSAPASASAWPDPLYGRVPVTASFNVPAGGASLNITPDPVRLTGTLSWDGASLPAAAANRWALTYVPPGGSLDDAVWAERTGDDGTNVFDVPALPGTWEVWFSWAEAAPENAASWLDPLFGPMLLGSLTVPAGGGTWSVAPDPLRLTGLLQWDGASLPPDGANAWRAVWTDPSDAPALTAPRVATTGSPGTHDVPAWPGVYHLEFQWVGTVAETSSAWPDPILGSLRVASCVQVQ